MVVAETGRRGRPRELLRSRPREWTWIWSGGGRGQAAGRSTRLPASQPRGPEAGRAVSAAPREGPWGWLGARYLILETLNFKTLPLSFENISDCGLFLDCDFKKGLDTLRCLP